MDKNVEKDFSISWPAKILFSAIDNNCNENDWFFYNQDKVNDWIKNTHSSSEIFHKRLIRELEGAGYLQKLETNKYKLIKRSIRKPKMNGKIDMQTSDTGYHLTSKKTSIYKYDKENFFLEIKRNGQNRKEFHLQPANNPTGLMFDGTTTELMSGFLDELHLNDFTKLLLEVYGARDSLPFWYPIRSYVKKLTEQYQVKRGDLLVSAFMYSRLDKYYEMTIVTWLKKGFVFDFLIKKDITNSLIYKTLKDGWKDKYFNKGKYKRKL
jgi:hypothetical protein